MTTTRRSRWLFVTAMTALALVSVGGAWRSAAGADGPRRQQLQLFEPFDEGVSELIDAGEPGFSAGDTFLEDHPLLPAAGGEPIGRLRRQAQVIAVHEGGDFTFLVHNVLFLADGQLHDVGAPRYSEVEAGTAVGQITGGTASYVGASGTIRGRAGQLGGHDGVFLTVDVIRAPGRG